MFARSLFDALVLGEPRSRFVAATFLVLASAPAAAEQYTSTFSGTVDRIQSQSSYSSDGRINVGNPVSLTLRYDSGTFTSNSTTTNAYTTTDYRLPISYSISYGGYSVAGTTTSDIVLMDNRPTFGGGLSDSIGFVFLAENPNTVDSPFVFPSGTVYSSANVTLVDQTGATLSDTSLASVLRTSTFPLRVSEFTFYNPDSNTSVTAFANLTSGSTVAGIPEPATWLTLIGGFGAAGGALRRTRNRRGAGVMNNAG